MTDHSMTLDKGKPGTVQRLIPLDTWIYENRYVLSAWLGVWYRSGRHSVSGPDNVPRWIRRHEKRLTEAGAVMRKGNAWRLIEPGCTEALRAILTEECERAARKGAGKRKAGAR